MKCRVCDEPTSWISNAEADPRFQETVHRMVERQERADALVEPLPRVTGDIDVHIEDDRYYIYQGDLIRAGLRLRNTEMHLFATRYVVWETVAWDEPNRRWWVDPIYPTDAVDQLDWEDVEPGAWVDEFIDRVLGKETQTDA